jgi:hypothetical protein
MCRVKSSITTILMGTENSMNIGSENFGGADISAHSRPEQHVHFAADLQSSRNLHLQGLELYCRHTWSLEARAACPLRCRSPKLSQFASSRIRVVCIITYFLFATAYTRCTWYTSCPAIGSDSSDKRKGKLQ